MSAASTTVVAEASEAEGLRYHELGRLGAPGGWRGPVGLLTALSLFLAAQIVASGVIATIVGARGDDPATVLDGDPATPSYLALVNLGWAGAIGATIVAVVVVHRQRAGRLASVLGRVRWGWFALCLPIAAITLGVTLAVASVLPDQGGGTVPLGGDLNPWTSAARDFVLVIVLLTPLQAAGEEYVFRGYLAQLVGGWGGRFGRGVAASVSVVVPAVLFALAHGAQDLPIFVDRLGFGLAAGVVVLVTGGLEAGIAMHVLNNFAAFGLALAFGDMGSALEPTAGSWWAIPVTLVQSLTFVALVTVAARRRGVEARTPAGASVLVAQRPRV